MTTHKNNKYNAGLTLVELLVVVSIIGIAATVIIPMIGDTSDLQVSAALRQMTSCLLYAQACAISEQRPCQVVFDSNNDNYSIQIQNQDGTYSPVTDPVNKIPHIVNLGAGSQYHSVSISNVNFDGSDSLWFDRLGAPRSGKIGEGNTTMNNPGTVTVTGKGQNMTVTVTPITGKIKIN